jgi:hypothetical protein
MSATITDKAAFKARVRRWAEKLGAQVTSITVRPMTTKWASYSTTGRLTFDAFLLELREELQDYVIAHELLHFHAPNHGKLCVGFATPSVYREPMSMSRVRWYLRRFRFVLSPLANGLPVYVHS